jgi:plasmid stabilization system protein ParE
VNPKYQLTASAQADVNEISAFIASDSLDAALRVVDALEAAFLQLSNNPEIGHHRDDLTDWPVKFWGVYS